MAWQRLLAKQGGTKTGKALSPNTIRLARCPLNGALKLAVEMGVIGSNATARVPRPRAGRSIPKHWSPEQAREFLTLMEGDRTYPVWAFLLGCGLRIGELVWLRWANVDLVRRRVQVVDFASTLGHDLVPSAGKSHDAVRSIELDDGLVRVLRQQRALQAEEALAASAYEASDYVFTKPDGGSYHPQFLSRLIARYSKELGLPRLTAHGLRHTSATLMQFGQRGGAEGGSRTVGARRSHAVHQPLQPRHPHHATGRGGQDRCRALRLIPDGGPGLLPPQAAPVACGGPASTRPAATKASRSDSAIRM